MRNLLAKKVELAERLRRCIQVAVRKSTSSILVLHMLWFHNVVGYHTGF